MKTQFVERNSSGKEDNVLRKAKLPTCGLAVSGVVSYFRQDELSVVHKTSGFGLLLPSISRGLSMPSTPCSLAEITSSYPVLKCRWSLRLCDSRKLDTLGRVLVTEGSLSLKVCISAKKSQDRVHFRAIVSGNWASQERVDMFLRYKLKLLTVDDPFKAKLLMRTRCIRFRSSLKRGHVT